MADERRKKKRTVREKNWDHRHEDAFTHDLRRHRRTDTALSDNAPAPDIPEDFEPNGLVISHSKKWAFVLWGGQPDGALGSEREGERTREAQSSPSQREDLCRISEHLLERRVTILAPGDRVLVELIDGEPWVRAVSPRTSKLSRPGGEHARVAEQVFAANIDILVVVAAAAKPPFRPGLVDRYIIAAEVGGVTPILCVNKMDLVENEPPELQAYRDLGVPVIPTSCKTGDGIDKLREVLRGTLSIFAGHSGVGKSSLLNALEPDLDLKTREVSESTDRGKHTTSAARLYQLDEGIRVVDTPGIRHLGLWGVTAEEVSFYFPEIAEFAPACKFRDCSHTHEPDCAVREASDTGAIPRQRLESYLRIRGGLEDDQSKY